MKNQGLISVRFALLLIAALATGMAASLGADDSPLDGFLQRIQSADDAVRMKARLEAPKHGAAAIDPLAKLMEGANREAAITARHALSGIVHHAGRPGAEAERAPCLAALVRLTHSSRGAFVRREALHLLGLIGGDAEVDAIAACLTESARQDGSNVQVGEAARLALERIPGEVAVRALQEAVAKVDEKRQPDLIFSLGKKGDMSAVEFLLASAKSSNDATRFASFQALAHLGAEVAVEPLRKILQRADDPLRARLFGEYLRLADELLETQSRSVPYAMYNFALRSAPHDYQRERALQRLCQRGDIASVPVLIRGLGDEAPRVSARALWLLDSLEGQAVFDHLFRGFEEASDAAKPAILRALAKSDAAASKDIIDRATGSENIDLKITALDLRGRVDPSLELLYLKTAREGSSSIRTAALRGYLSLAEKRLEDGGKAEALQMFAQGLQTGREADERRRALSGILKIGDPASIDLLAASLADPILSREAATGYIAFAAKIAETDVDRADEYLQAIVGGKFPPDLVVQAATVLRKIGRDPRRPALEKGFVLDWWLIGPMQDKGTAMADKFFPEERVRLKVVERIEARRYRWKKFERLSLDGKVNLILEFRRSQNVIAYAYTELESPIVQKVHLRIGSDDGVKCWVNGAKVHDNPGPRGYAVDQDIVPVDLVQGKNRILLKIGQGTVNWEFSLRVTDAAGKPVVLPGGP